MSGGVRAAPVVSAEVEAMFQRYAWVEVPQRICHLRSGDLLTREQFNVRNNHIGNPASWKDCAWAVLVRDADRLRTVRSVTYRPGGGLFVHENLPGLTGLCVNQWRDPRPNLPLLASEAEVWPWLSHVELVLPNPDEREVVLNYLAWIIQNPGLKPNWSLVIGSSYEGIGKDLMLEPVRVALGPDNVREIRPEDLDSQYTWFLARTRLLIVEEMKVADRKVSMNRLKPLVAAPPYSLTVNAKFQPQYEIPNILAVIFFTNMENALAVNAYDRRYYVTWNDAPPLAPDYYESLVDWYQSGGAAVAARWLLERDVSAFKAQGRAPDTAAKTNMGLACLPPMEATIREGVAKCDGPFRRRLVTLAEAMQWLGQKAGLSGLPDEKGLARMLREAGALQRRVWLGPPPGGCEPPPQHDGKQTQVFSMPGDRSALDLFDDLSALRAEFWGERRRARADLGVGTGEGSEQ